MAHPALIPESEARKLSTEVVRLWRWQLMLVTAAAVVVAAIPTLLVDVVAPIGTAVIVAILLVGVVSTKWWPRARHRSWSFAVRDEDVVLRRGVWWRVTSIVPHARIQHVDTTHGPWERKLGLSSVVLFTAGHVGASIRIPGLPAAEADELRDRLAALGRTGEAV